jgi:thiol:disulfide interchange protein
MKLSPVMSVRGVGLGEFLTVLVLALGCSGEARAAPVKTEHVDVELLTESGSIQPGKSFTVGTRLTIQPNWHIYWVNAGDAGVATAIAWSLPPGFSAAGIEWPYPHRLSVEGGQINYGYTDQVMLLTQLTAPAKLPAGQATVKAHVSWLVCSDVCIPGSADVSASPTVSTVSGTTPTADPRWIQAFSQSRRQLPVATPEWKFSAQATDDGYRLIAEPVRSGVKLPNHVFFFSQDEVVVENSAPQPISIQGGKLVADLAKATFATDAAKELRGVWVASPASWSPGVEAAAIDVPVEPLAVTDVPVKSTENAPVSSYVDAAAVSSGEGAASASSTAGFIGLAALAVIGGLILNLMPCVFPVLGLKIISFVKQAGEDRKRVVAHGLVFTAGVLLSFWGLAILLAVLRAGGHHLGWGFQLQSPAFVFALSVVMLIFAMNMSGVFEFSISATRIGSSLQNKSGFIGSFFTGFLATVVATPCSAPFLAPALGAAVAMPAGQSFLLFSAIGIGLSLPYLLLSLFPSAVRLLPRPGRWMETFKQMMAFPLYATVVYLLWILAGQVTADGLLYAAWGLMAIAMGLWAYGRWSLATIHSAAGSLSRTGSFGVAVVLLVALSSAGIWLGWPRAAVGYDKVVWQPWSPEAIAKLRSEDRLIYVDFTARWCATCQANEKLVFHSEKVLHLFAQKNIATLKADWTNQDPRITAELAQYHRSAIPFNLVYIPGRTNPVILPAVLTPSVVMGAVSGG